jgi:hypothetical protein
LAHLGAGATGTGMPPDNMITAAFPKLSLFLFHELANIADVPNKKQNAPAIPATAGFKMTHARMMKKPDDAK